MIRERADLEAGRRLAFCYPGQGSYYIGAGLETAGRFPLVGSRLDEAYDLVRNRCGVEIQPLFQDVGGSRPVTHLLERPEVLQPLLFAIEAATTDLFRDEFGIRPDAAAGHSLGEIAALYCADVLSFEDGITIAYERGRAMAEIAPRNRGGMVAVFVSPEELAALLAEHGLAELTIANYNHPGETVLSGEAESIKHAIGCFDKAGATFAVLETTHAFHSPLVASAREPVMSALKDITLSAPTLPVISNLDAREYPSDPDEIRRRIADQIIEPVRWSDGIARLQDDRIRCWVSLGPGSILPRLVRANLKPGGQSHATLISGHEYVTTLKTLGALFEAGVPMKLRGSLGLPEPETKRQDRVDPVLRQHPDWNRILERVVEMLAHATNRSVDPAGRDQLVDRLGMDSLSGLEFLDKVYREFRVEAAPDPTRVAEIRGEDVAAMILQARLDGAVGKSSSPAPSHRLRWISPRRRTVELPSAEGPLPTPVFLFGEESRTAQLAERCRSRGLEVTREVEQAAAVFAAPGPGASDLVALLRLLATFYRGRPSGSVTVWSPPGEFAGAYGGLVRCLRREFPRVSCLSVNAEDVAMVVEAASQPAEVAYHEIRAWGDDTEELSFEVVAPPPAGEALTRGDVVIVTGGARGITAECITELARKVSGLRFVLGGTTRLEGDPREFVDSSTKAGEVARTIVALEELGAQVHYQRSDVTRDDDVRALVAAARRWGFPRLVVHAAGIDESAPLTRKTADSLDKVVRTKLDGARSLVEAALDSSQALGDGTAASPPKFLFFGSVASLGNLNQADYGAANGYLGSLARDLRRRGIDATTLHWSAWARIGLAARNEATLRALEAVGVETVEPEHGRAAFVRAVLADPCPEPEYFVARGLGSVDPVCDELAAWSLDPTDWFLRDHCIVGSGSAVVPAVIVIDHFVSSTFPETSGRSVVCRDLRWTQLLTVDGKGREEPREEKGGDVSDGTDQFRSGENRTVTVRQRRGFDDDRTPIMSFWIHDGAPDACTAEVFASGKVERHSVVPTDQPVPQTLPDGGWVDAKSLYPHLFKHGPTLQAIDRMTFLSRGVALAVIQPKANRRVGSVIDPVALEGALQAAGCLHLRETQQSCLPTGIDRLVWTLGAPPAMLVRAQRVGRVEGGQVYDLALLTADGETVATVEGYSVAAVGERFDAAVLRALG